MVYKLIIFCEEFSRFEKEFYKDGDYLLTMGTYKTFDEAYQKMDGFIKKQCNFPGISVVDDTFNGQKLLVLTNKDMRKIIHLSIREE